LKEKIKKLTNSLRGLNIDNQKFNNELLNIYQELYPKIKLNKKINKSFEINENNIGKEESLIKQIKNNQIKI
jgi:hypothetical protein